MNKIVKPLLTSLASLAVVSCGSYQLSEHAKDIRTRMTLRQAESLLGGYARPGATRGGLCMTGEREETHLDYNAPVRISDFVLKFTAFYAAQQEQYALDARDLREIRVLEANPQVTARCRNYKPGYVIVLKPEKGVPDQADVSINASSQSELDTILAALTTMSPQARVRSGGFF